MESFEAMLEADITRVASSTSEIEVELLTDTGVVPAVFQPSQAVHEGVKVVLSLQGSLAITFGGEPIPEGSSFLDNNIANGARLSVATSSLRDYTHSKVCWQAKKGGSWVKGVVRLPNGHVATADEARVAILDFSDQASVSVRYNPPPPFPCPILPPFPCSIQPPP